MRTQGRSGDRCTLAVILTFQLRSSALPKRTPSPPARRSRRPHLGVWLAATRPKTLPAAVIPVVVGMAATSLSGSLNWTASLVLLVVSLLLQIASNFANDVYDFERGADGAARAGPLRAVSAGLISATAMKRALLFVLALAATMGVYLTAIGGPAVALVGLAAMLVAVGYTGGPFPLAYHGLGDVFVFLFFGATLGPASAYLSLGHVPPLVWACGLPMGFLSMAILVVNNVRDIESDRAAHKRTLVVMYGRDRGLRGYQLLLLGTFLSLLLIGWLLDSPWAVIPLLSAPLALRLTKELRERRGGALNKTLARTAGLLALFGLLLILGLRLSVLF